MEYALAEKLIEGMAGAGVGVGTGVGAGVATGGVVTGGVALFGPPHVMTEPLTTNNVMIAKNPLTRDTENTYSFPQPKPLWILYLNQAAAILSVSL
jgi:hypothetical protein